MRGLLLIILVFFSLNSFSQSKVFKDSTWTTTLVDSVVENSFKYATIDSIRVGGVNNYLKSDSSGFLTYFGNSRFYRSIWNYAYNMYGRAGTFNSEVCNACGTSILANQFVLNSFDQSTSEACVMTFRLPTDYEVGSTMILEFNWCAAATTGTVSFGVGLNPIDGNESYNASVYNYLTGTGTPSAVSYGMVTNSVLFSSLTLRQNSDVGIVFYRDANNSSDTMLGDALVSTIRIKYISNKNGGKL